MTGLVCITNEVAELRPCSVAGEHSANCWGFGTRWDRDESRRVVTDTECKGCLPEPATVGLLCWSCWEKVRDALGNAVDVITHLRSIERAGQVDNAGVRSASGWVIPIPNTWRTADDLLVLLGHPTPGFPSTADVDEVQAIAEKYVGQINIAMWIARVESAKDAVRFVALTRSTLIQHPMEDYEHRVRNVRCPDCGRRSLLWKPPLMFEGEVHVVCTNPECLFVVDQDGYTDLTHSAVVEAKAKMTLERLAVAAARRVNEKALRDAANVVAAAERERVEAESA
jgi:hypothetical protein